MATYRCLVRGENFARRNHAGRELVGFYTTRWVEAVNPEEAEYLTVARLRKEPDFQQPEGYAPNAPAKVFIEEIEPVDALPTVQGGATWFRMDEQLL